MSATAADYSERRAERLGSNRLLWLAGGMFAVLLAAWATLFMLAHRHPVETVPLSTPATKK